MKIINLKAENIKRIIAVDITPKGNLIQITGKNGNGKTSVLDSIWWCLAGAQNVQSKPIRTGEDQAYVTLDMGEMIATRSFKYNKDGEITQSLKVENKDGIKFTSPQAVLDKLLGDLTFDPLAFARMDARGQFDTMRRFVPNVDFKAIDDENKADYEKRKEINRKLKEKQAESNAITAKQCDRVDTSELLKKMQDASTFNSDIETRRANRKNLERRVLELQEQIGQLTDEAEKINMKLVQAGQLPATIDISKIGEEISEAEKNNKEVDLFLRKKQLIEGSNDLIKKSESLTESIETRTKNKQQAISEANLPVDGITFGDDEIILNGQPFNQASDAEQLRASLAIAMALNPELRVIRVRDGSLLDEDSMKIVEQMAIDKDFQIFIERVDGSGKVGFIMEAGEIKQQMEEFE